MATKDSGSEPSTSGQTVSDPGQAKRRNRPGKNQRQRARAAATQGTPAETSAPVTSEKNKPKAAAFASGSSGPAFTPGKYPVVFNAMPGEATVDRRFIPDVPVACDHIQRVFLTLHSSERFLSFMADVVGVTGNANALIRFQRLFEAMGLLVLAQNVVLTQDKLGLPLGDFSILSNANIPHLRCLRIVLSQYGCFQLPEVGQRWRVAAYSDVVKTLIRMAAQLVPRDGQVLDDAASASIVSRWWIPVRRGDEKCRVVYTSRLSDLVGEAFQEISVKSPLVVDQVYSGNVPGWFRAVSPTVLPVNPNALDFVFGNEPNTVAGWVGQFTGANADRLQSLGLEWVNPANDHLAWTMNHKDEVDRLITAWSSCVPTLRRHFELTDRSSSSDSIGWSTQLMSLMKMAPVVVTRQYLVVGAGEASLATAFPPRCIPLDEVDTDVVNSTTVTLSERVSEWINRDFRS